MFKLPTKLTHFTFSPQPQSEVNLFRTLDLEKKNQTRNKFSLPCFIYNTYISFFEISKIKLMRKNNKIIHIMTSLTCHAVFFYFSVPKLIPNFRSIYFDRIRNDDLFESVYSNKFLS